MLPTAVSRRLSTAICLGIAAMSALPGRAAEPPPFKHPGGLHTIEDLDRMKHKVAARETPWIQGWEALVRDPLASAAYRSGARSNMGASRQTASRDAHAAYLNFIRWYVGGDRAHADTAIRICNEWSAAMNEKPAGPDIPGLNGIFTAEFAMVGELLRACPHWEPADQERFKRMLRTYLYPVVSGFLSERNRRGDSYFWANWDIANIQALIAMGVFLDDRAIFDEGVEYYKHGRGTGSIMNAVPFLHPGNLGQWQESGRDQPHAHLGIGMLGQACTVAWNQGVDLFGLADNRLLAAAEYAAREALSQPVPYSFYTNTSEANNHWLTNHTRGRFTTPVWELLHNHYVVRQRLSAPAVTRVAGLSRPELGGWDHFGYGTLTFTLDAEASPYPPLPPPAAPAGLTATPGLGRVYLNWDAAAAQDTSGYIVRRSKADAADFETIGEWWKNSTPAFVDRSAEPGVTYHYVVIARNQAGESPASEPARATAGAPGPLQDAWSLARIGSRKQAGKPQAAYSADGSRTLRLRGTGADIGGGTDDAGFAYTSVSGDFILTTRVVGPGPDELARSPLSKFGLMVRESLAPGARMAALTLGEGGTRGTRARFRSADGEMAAISRGNDYTWSPIWYRLTRKGNEFLAEHSVDGRDWFEVGKASIAMPPDVLLGFILTTRDPEQPGEVLFESIELDR